MISLSKYSALAEEHQQSAAAQFSNTGIQLDEMPFVRMVRLQGPGADERFCAQIAHLLMPLAKPTQVTNQGAWRCAWLTPNEWVFISAEASESQLIEASQPALHGRLAMATTITDSRVVIAVSGAAAVDLLAKACALDLHSSFFDVGQCAVARFAKIAVLIMRTENHVEVVCDRSQSRYLWQWLVDAAAEFGT